MIDIIVIISDSSKVKFYEIDIIFLQKRKCKNLSYCKSVTEDFAIEVY